MTTTDIRPANSIEFDTENPPVLTGEIVPGTPVYMVPDNPWVPWTSRATGAAMGSWLASAVTFLLTPHLFGWALGASIAVTLLFAWVIGGRDLYERYPKKFKQAP